MTGLPIEDATRLLLREGVSAEEAELLARWSSGSPGRALLFRSRGIVPLVELLAGVLAGRIPPMRAAANLWDLPGTFPGKTPAAKARGRARFVLDLCLDLSSDAEKLDAGFGVDAVPFGDLASPLLARGHAGRRATFDALLGCRADVDRNLGPEGVLERALLAWGGAGPIVGRAPMRR